MFKDFKKWSRRIMTRIRPNNGCIIHRLIQGADSGYNDPRELPRPPRELIALGFIKKSSKKSSPLSKECSCANCQILYEEFSECFVCTDPLQQSASSDQGIISCVKCGNVCCFNCIQKLSSCAFCRTPFDTQSHSYVMNMDNTHIIRDRIRNLPLERLVARLHLPCRNSKFGCTQQLTIENRLEHEMICTYTQIACPFQSQCQWEGQGKNIIEHLSELHRISIVPANGIDMEISDIRKKTKPVNDQPSYRQYFMCLVCHQKLFMCKVNIGANNLRLAFQQIDGTFFNNYEQDLLDKRAFSAWIEVHGKRRKLQGLFRISDGENREQPNIMQYIEIPTKHLATKCGSESVDSTIDDMRICITIIQGITN